ncbi:hypothetical protein X777_11557 [Ooceraea biroi]|uniref:Uncharacterized protein n=1 Tax=Ooceraea biroi TaxID=2015173 RepID=A0A026W513_OOCBI|nr:hypothetical protein X777_11557 [Ooceraea biroi]
MTFKRNHILNHFLWCLTSVSVRGANLSFSEVVSLLGLADDDEVLAGTSEESRKRALWQFYSTGMLTHSHSDGEFPIYSQGECKGGWNRDLSGFRFGDPKQNI